MQGQHWRRSKRLGTGGCSTPNSMPLSTRHRPTSRKRSEHWRNLLPWRPRLPLRLAQMTPRMPRAIRPKHQTRQGGARHLVCTNVCMCVGRGTLCPFCSTAPSHAVSCTCGLQIAWCSAWYQTGSTTATRAQGHPANAGGTHRPSESSAFSAGAKEAAAAPPSAAFQRQPGRSNAKYRQLLSQKSPLERENGGSDDGVQSADRSSGA